MSKLEIILVTYNRRRHLQNTFNQIFAENSPIRNLSITILDNKSDDGTRELIEEYIQKFPNIKHIINDYNIGGNANIARAFEIAKSEYVWILCDDDEFDFTHWNEAEKAMNEGYDAIVTANYINPEKNLAQLLAQLSFVPAAIYKTSNITDTVMTNMYYNISNMFPQISLPCALINANKNFKILKDALVRMVVHSGEDSYDRGTDETCHPFIGINTWGAGFINAIQIIKDPNIKKFIIQNLLTEDGLKPLTNKDFIIINKVYAKNSLNNNMKYLACIDCLQRIKFVFIYLLTNIMFIVKTNYEYRLYVFNKKLIKVTHKRINKLLKKTS